jgi:hypothetical protein
MTDLEKQWYWDRRTNKAYYPIEDGEDTVTFATVWHEDEVAGALDGGAVVPIEEIGLDRAEDRTFDLIDSFRTPAVMQEDS